MKNEVLCPECGHEFDPEDEGYEPECTCDTIDQDDVDNTAREFAEWIFRHNITKSEDVANTYLFIGKMLTIRELYDIFEDGKGAGFKISIVEPIGIIETTNTPWNIVALGTKFAKSVGRKQGNSRDDGHNKRYTHFVAFPVMAALNFVQDISVLKE